jgi:protein-histidine pros-kinase
MPAEMPDEARPTPRRRPAEPTRTLAERLAAVLRAATEYAIVGTDPQGLITDWSAGAERMLGYRAEEVVGTAAPLLLHAAAEVAARAAELGVEPGFAVFARAAQAGEVETREWTYVRKDASRLRVSLSVTAVRGADGAVLGFMGVARDVTRDRQTEALLDRANHQRELLLGAAAEGIVGLDRGGTVTFANPAAGALLGYAPEELDGQPFHERVRHSRADGSPCPREECPCYAALADGATHRARGELFWRKDGTALPVDLVSAPIRERGAITGAVVVFQDVSDRQRAEAERARLLRRAEAAEARFRGLLESAPDAIVVTGDDGRIALVNRQTERLFGYPREELLGQSVDRLVPDRLRAGHAAHRARYAAAPAARPMGAGLDLSARRKDGTEFPAEISLSLVAIGDELLVAAAVRDVTWRKEAEAERARLLDRDRELRAEHERLKDEFFANVSHDLRTPVTAIKASVGVVLANEPPGLPEPLHRMLVNVDLAADRMIALVSDLLELSRLQAGRVRLEPERHDLRDLARRAARAVEALLQARGQRLELTLPGAPVVALVDAGRLERALLNLLSNAHKFGREGGTIRLGLERRPGEAVFSFADDGPGIPAADRERVFERFYRAGEATGSPAPGSGLGLAIARAMAELHGGRIWVASAPGPGATFCLAAPVAPDRERTGRRAQPEVEPERTGES